MQHVAIIGGGLAGLAAGVELAQRGVRVSVLEARPHLGGRAYSFVDAASGEVVDNGQHAMMSCYRHSLDFFTRIGAANKLSRQPNLRVAMIDARGGHGVIAAAPLPSPLHMLAGILRYGLLGRRERVLAVLGGARLMAWRRRRDPRLGEQTVEQVLVALGQSPRSREVFWDPVAVATLNERPQRACAAPFAEVLARAFFGHRNDSQFVLARVGLSDLYTGDARRFIEERGGTVECGAIVQGLRLAGDRCTALELRGGRQLAVDACISAVPPRALAALLPGLVRPDDLGSAPIVSVHLWLDRPVLADDFAGLIGTTAQWLFNRTRLTANGAPMPHDRQHLSAVISAAHDLCEWPSERIVAAVVGDLHRCLASARQAQVQRTVVIKEKHATVSLTPEAERRRPAARTAIANLFLAGDWVQTGLPATIESAVLSGHHAATLVAASEHAQ